MTNQTNDLTWHNRQITKIVRSLMINFDINRISRIIMSTNIKAISNRINKNEEVTLGVRPLVNLAKKLNCRIHIVIMPDEDAADFVDDGAYELKQAIKLRNEKFYKSLETGISDYCKFNEGKNRAKSRIRKKRLLKEIHKLI